jgi:hypothetical protein
MAKNIFAFDGLKNLNELTKQTMVRNLLLTITVTIMVYYMFMLSLAILF